MTKEREGFRMLGLQVPIVLCDKLFAEAEERDVPATQVLTEILRKHYRIGKDQLPKRKKTGPKPKP